MPLPVCCRALACAAVDRHRADFYVPFSEPAWAAAASARWARLQKALAPSLPSGPEGQHAINFLWSTLRLGWPPFSPVALPAPAPAAAASRLPAAAALAPSAEAELRQLRGENRRQEQELVACRAELATTRSKLEAAQEAVREAAVLIKGPAAAAAAAAAAAGNGIQPRIVTEAVQVLKRLPASTSGDTDSSGTGTNLPPR